jgi:hypothetical protein
MSPKGYIALSFLAMSPKGDVALNIPILADYPIKLQATPWKMPVIWPVKVGFLKNFFVIWC